MTMFPSISARWMVPALVALATISLVEHVNSSADVPSALLDADPEFLSSWQFEIEKQVELLSAAYGLDEDGKNNLRTELEQRLIQEHDFEAKMSAELAELSLKAQKSGANEDEESPEMKAIANRFSELTLAMPLHENQVAQWVESRVSPDVAQEGHQRWEELVRRRSMVEEANNQANEQVTGLKSGLVAETREMRIRKSAEDGIPLPRGNNGDFVDAETMRRAGRPYVNPADITTARERQGMASPATAHEKRTGYSPSSPANRASKFQPTDAQPGRPTVESGTPGSPPQPPPPTRLRPSDSATLGLHPAAAMPAPPLDEWEKYVITVSQKYGFDGAQNMRAQSILSDLRKRAYQYQLSRSEEFAKTQLLTDATVRGETLKRLNIPLNALFAELKQRLESLPTMAQKQRQGQPPAAKKNR